MTEPRDIADLPRALRELLPPSTANAWRAIAPALPDSAVLYGGTGITAHLLHRVSRDLDFFLFNKFEPPSLAESLAAAGRFVVTSIAEGTLNGLLEDTKVQFLDATGQNAVESSLYVGGIPVAGIGDLLATKLKVIGDRGALRDYFDIMMIEQSGRPVEHGLAIYARRYGLTEADFALTLPLRGLLYMDDVLDDPTLPVPRDVIERYWTDRRKSLLAHLDRF